MDMLYMCRICLSNNTNMHNIVGTKLQKVYEKLTELPFQTEDNRSLQICYICCARLWNCYRLQINCLRSHELFNQILTNNMIKTTLKNNNSFKIVHPRIQLSCIPLTLMEPDDDDEDIDEHGNTKEIIHDVQIKEEIIEDAHDNIIDYTENIKYTGLESIVKIERDDTEDNHAINHSINSEIAEENSTINHIELNKADKVIKEERIQPTELDDEQLLRDVDEVNRNSTQTDQRIACMKSIDDKLLKPVKTVFNRDDVDSITGAADVKEEVTTSTLGTITLSTTSSNSETEDSLEQNITYKRPNIENTEKNIINNSSKIHTVDKPYMCKVCEKCFGKKGHLTEHIRIHTGEKPYRCNICDKSFRQSSSLVHHKQVHIKAYKLDEYETKTGGHVDILDKPFKCNICNRSYIHKNSLTRHTSTHTGGKTYICDVCEKSFTNREVLKNHIRIHSDEKLYKCNVCEKCFKIRSCLTSHKLIHTGVKPHKCKICHKCFTLNSDLTRHIRRHTGEKPYKCDICDKKFIRNCDLIGHRRIHTGEKPYKCNICDKRFTVKSALNVHSHTHRNNSSR